MDSISSSSSSTFSGTLTGTVKVNLEKFSTMSDMAAVVSDAALHKLVSPLLFANGLDVAIVSTAVPIVFFLDLVLSKRFLPELTLFAASWISNKYSASAAAKTFRKSRP